MPTKPSCNYLVMERQDLCMQQSFPVAEKIAEEEKAEMTRGAPEELRGSHTFVKRWASR